MAALVAQLKELKDGKLRKDDPAVREFRKKIEAFRDAAKDGITDTRWPKLEAYLAETELPEDTLRALKPQVATLLAGRPIR